ncbi:hypothetical protein BDZ97DRAFT_1765642 [Flammula alnicola]|nr:hypothetical protein BDZ97DRAFT_1765642 [Flammula alnicola]
MYPTHMSHQASLVKAKIKAEKRKKLEAKAALKKATEDLEKAGHSTCQEMPVETQPTVSPDLPSFGTVDGKSAQLLDLGPPAMVHPLLSMDSTGFDAEMNFEETSSQISSSEDLTSIDSDMSVKLMALKMVIEPKLSDVVVITCINGESQDKAKGVQLLQDSINGQGSFEDQRMEHMEGIEKELKDIQEILTEMKEEVNTRTEDKPKPKKRRQQKRDAASDNFWEMDEDTQKAEQDDAPILQSFCPTMRASFIQYISFSIKNFRQYMLKEPMERLLLKSDVSQAVHALQVEGSLGSEWMMVICLHKDSRYTTQAFAPGNGPYLGGVHIYLDGCKPLAFQQQKKDAKDNRWRKMTLSDVELRYSLEDICSFVPGERTQYAYGTTYNYTSLCPAKFYAGLLVESRWSPDKLRRLHMESLESAGFIVEQEYQEFRWSPTGVQVVQQESRDFLLGKH